MANATPDPAEALPSRFKHQVMAIRGLIESADAKRPNAAARGAPGRLEQIRTALQKQGPLDTDIDRVASELKESINDLDGMIAGSGAIGPNSTARITTARASANQKLDELIDLLPTT